jgi:CHAD domain-containing protein
MNKFMMEQKIYHVNPKSSDLATLLSALAEGKTADIVEEETRIYEKEYFDTFDARLLKSNMSLHKYNNLYTLELPNASKKKFALKQKINSLKSFPADLKKILDPVLKIRSLLPAIKTQNTETIFILLNEDQKIVLRGKYEKITFYNDGGEVDSKLFILTLMPLRGYEKKLIKAERIITEHDFGKKLEKKELQKIILSKSKNLSINYTNKTNFNLNSNTKSYIALNMILKTLVKVIEINEKGIISDSDSEFLHDYRVAIRKTRAILGQLNKIFNSEFLEKHKVDLADIASTTNKLRDMDVYLLSENEYKDMLPKHLHQELDVFFKDVTKKKRKEHRIVSNMLLSNAYNEKIKAWKKFLASEDKKFWGAEGEKKVKKLAKYYIYNRYLKIIKQGNKVKKTSPDIDFHRVRISCKKLRYLIELFSSLFPKDEISIAAKQLKNIQDSLGNFNDMCMQQIHLDEYLHELSGRKHDNPKIAAAIGGLITSTHNRKNDYRNEFHQKFNKFIDIKNNILFKKLFK